MELFKRPKWLRPELERPIYYVHVAIIAVVVLGLLELFVSPGMFNVKNVLISIPLITVGDAISHTLLGLD